MLIDLVFVILIFAAIFKGLRNGLIIALFTLVGYILGLALAVKLSTVAADYIGSAVNISQRWLPLVAFILVFVGVVVAVRLGAKALEGVVQVAMLGWLNRLGGILFFALLYIFVFSIVLFYLSQTGFIKEETAQASVAYPSIQPLGPKVIDGLSAVVPLFKNMFTELEAFFDPVINNKS